MTQPRLFPARNSVEHSLFLFYAFKIFEYVQIDGAIWYFFYHQYHHVSPGQATTLFSLTFMISVFLEIPSSAWADRFSRKRVLIAAHLFLIVSYLLFAVASSTTFLVAAIVCRAVHSALSSGTMEGLLYDNLAFHHQEIRFNKIIAHGHSAFFVGRATFMILGAYLYLISPTLPYIVGILMSVYLLLVCGLLPEHPYQRSDASTNTQQTIRTAQHLWNCIPLRTFLLYVLVAFTLGDMIWVVLQPFFLSVTHSYVGVGIAYAGIAGFSAIGSRMAGVLQERVSSGRLMLCSGVCLCLTALTMALTNSSIQLVCFALIAICWGFGYPITMKEINANVSADMRATAGSVFSQLESFGIAVFGALSGYLYGSYPTTFFLGIAAVSLIATALFFIPLTRSSTAPIPSS
jgi:predicted MFS family arabinose efflux permease